MNETKSALIPYEDETSARVRPAWQIELHHAEANAWRAAEKLSKAARKKARKVAQASRHANRKA